MVDTAVLDEAVRRFPAVLRRARAYFPFRSVGRKASIDCVASPHEVGAICREYRLILVERMKSERRAA